MSIANDKAGESIKSRTGCTLQTSVPNSKVTGLKNANIGRKTAYTGYTYNPDKFVAVTSMEKVNFLGDRRNKVYITTDEGL